MMHIKRNPEDRKQEKDHKATKKVDLLPFFNRG